MIILYLIFKNQLNNLYLSEVYMYGSSALRMFGRNQSIAKAVSAGAGRASGVLGNASARAGMAGMGRTNRMLSAGARGLGYAQRNPRRAMGGAGLVMGGIGMAGDGRRNNSPYQASNPYAS
jgi:hypothetical protein